MQTDISTLDALKKELRRDMEHFSIPLQALMVRFDPKSADRHHRATYAGFQEELGHTSKDLAYAFGKIDAAAKYEPTITEAEIIQETLQRYKEFKKSIIGVAKKYGIDPQAIKPLDDVTAESIQHCEAALEKVGGPRLRRTFKFEMRDLLGSEKKLLDVAQQHMSLTPLTREGQLALFEEHVDPELDKIYRLPDYVATGKLGFEDAVKLLARAKEGFETLTGQRNASEIESSMKGPLAPIVAKLDAAQLLCERYAREDYQSRGPGRSPA